MCGICGTVGSHEEASLATMCGLLAHRGPDGEGMRRFDRVDGTATALGHRRLAILDPTPAGAQPMGYGEGRWWITYNGELYNFRELRRELEPRGHRFVTECDTEVLLAAYAEWGAAMLDRLRGIYAFAIWDQRAEELFLARDRLGVKPLYYAKTDEGFAFASEPKAVLAAGASSTIDHDALAEYLTFLWVPDPATLFAQVRKLPPGHCALYSADELRIRPYWDLEFEIDEEPTEREWIAQVRETTQESIRAQMISDVPLGAFLSGGLDSGTVVKTMNGEVGRVSTYTIGFDERDLAYDLVPDDLRYARRLSETLDVDYHERMLEPDVIELLPALMHHLDDPIADPAAISTYLICSEAREELTVILSGMGADEIFAGYPRHLAASFGRPLDWVPMGMRRAARTGLEGRLSMGEPGRFRAPRRNAMKFLRGIDGSAIERYLTSASYYRPDELPTILAPDVRAAMRGADPFHLHREASERVSTEHWLNQLLYIDAKTFLPCLNLAYTDKMSMAASTEVRVPLIDDELVNLTARMPASLKLNGRTRKYALKKAMEGVLPDDIVWRPKAGFGAPIRAWLSGPLRPMVADLLAEEQLRRRGLVDPQAVARLIRDNDAGVADNALRIWALLVLELWMQRYVDAPEPASSGVAATASS